MTEFSVWTGRTAPLDETHPAFDKPFFGYRTDDAFAWYPRSGNHPDDRWYRIATVGPFTVDGITYNRDADGSVDTARTMIEIRGIYNPRGPARLRWDLPPLTDTQYDDWWDVHRGPPESG